MMIIAFGAYDVLLRNLGVRESPKSGDYVLSLLELNKEIGASRLNANELKSVIEVVSLAASNDQNLTRETICAPDLSGKLVNIKDLLQNDQPWLVNSQRLDLEKIHLCHPKLSKELLNKLQIRSMSQQVHEVLDDNLVIRTVPNSSENFNLIEERIHSEEFISAMISLVPQKLQERMVDGFKKVSIVKVEEIRTRFVLVRSSNNRSSAIDVTNRLNTSSTPCFITKERMLISKLPRGVSTELVVATTLCDKYNIPREHLGGICAILSSPPSYISELKVRMGLHRDEFHDELLRGDAGQTLVSIDRELAVVKPLKAFKKGEIVAIRSPTDESQLIYGTVTEVLDGNSLSRLTISIGKGVEKTFLTSEVYSLGRPKVGESSSASHSVVEELDISCLENGLISNEEDEFEAALMSETDEKTKMAPVKRSEILTAVQDLLQSANLSLNHDAKKMLDSNLSLQEALSQKDRQIESVEKKTNEIAKNAMSSVDSFLCPITREPMTDPVICCDGHTYERTAIELWLRNNSRSPKTNQPLASREVISNHALRNAIDAMNALRESVITVLPHLEEE